MENKLIKRFVESRVLAAVKSSRVAELLGARQVGKTVLAKIIAKKLNGKFVTFDNRLDLEFAKNDPKEFIEQAKGKLLVIDEVQKCPELIPEIKIAVDNNNKKGQFLLTGSSNLTSIKEISETLAGRAEIIEMFGFSQDELIGKKSKYLQKMFNANISSRFISSHEKSDYLKLAEAGSYPELVISKNSNPQNWIKSYLHLILSRDVKAISGIRRTSDLPRILKYIASVAGKELVISNMANDLNIPRATLDPYIEALETLFLIKRIDNWSNNLTARVISNKKTFIVDAGIANYYMKGTNDYGRLFENFIYSEVIKLVNHGSENIAIFHFRDYAKKEVDLILENEKNEMVGIEIKFSSTLSYSDAKILREMKDKYKKKMKKGIVVYTGKEIVPMGNDIFGVPASFLWEG